MLEVDHVDLHYGAAIALRQVSLTAEVGAVTCLLGRNGVGKTSLLRAITGAHPVSAGAIRWEGADITRLADSRPRAARHRLGAAGARHLSAADGAGKSGDRIRRAATSRSVACRTRCSSCFRC